MCPQRCLVKTRIAHRLQISTCPGPAVVQVAGPGPESLPVPQLFTKARTSALYYRSQAFHKVSEAQPSLSLYSHPDPLSENCKRPRRPRTGQTPLGLAGSERGSLEVLLLLLQLEEIVTSLTVTFLVRVVYFIRIPQKHHTQRYQLSKGGKYNQRICTKNGQKVTGVLKEGLCGCAGVRLRQKRR